MAELLQPAQQVGNGHGQEKETGLEKRAAHQARRCGFATPIFVPAARRVASR